jgi:hypothetical protein
MTKKKIDELLKGFKKNGKFENEAKNLLIVN